MHLRRQPTVGDRLALRLPINYFPLLLRMDWFAGRKKIDRFEQVGLTLGVLALQQGKRLLKIKLQPLVVAIVGE